MGRRLALWGCALGWIFALAAPIVVAAPVPVADFSFETPVLSPGLATGPGSWNTGGSAGGGAGIYEPTSPLPGQDGDRVGRVFTVGQPSPFGVLFQDITYIQEGTYFANFNASFEPGFEPTSSPLRVYFERVPLSGSQASIGGDQYNIGTIDSTAMTELVATTTVGPGALAIGQYLRIVVITSGTDPGTNVTTPQARYNVDNFELFHVPLEGGDPTPIPLGDPSFELKPWQTGSNQTGGSGQFRPAAPLFPNQNGDQLGFLSVRGRSGSFSALFQDATTVAPGSYTMTVGAAHDPGFAPTTTGLLLLIEGIASDGGKTTLASQTFPVGAFNSTMLTDVSLNLTIPEGSAHIGKDLRLVMVASGADAGTNPADPRATYIVDNVRLDFTPATTGFTADFDGDNAVDGDDFVSWKAGFGTAAGAAKANGDADGDQDVDGADFLTWQQQRGSGTSSAAVPEPQTALLVAIAGAAIVNRRRRQDR